MCEGVKKGFLERMTFQESLMGRWDVAGPGGRGGGVQVEGFQGGKSLMCPRH